MEPPGGQGRVGLTTTPTGNSNNKVTVAVGSTPPEPTPMMVWKIKVGPDDVESLKEKFGDGGGVSGFGVTNITISGFTLPFMVLKVLNFIRASYQSTMFSGLREIKLKNSSVSRDCIDLLVQTSRICSKISCIKLVNVTEPEMKFSNKVSRVFSLFHSLKSSSELTTLQLVSCDLTPGDVASLSQALRTNQCLKHLDISKNSKVNS